MEIYKMTTKEKIEEIGKEIKKYSTDKNFYLDSNVPKELKDEYVQLLLQYKDENPDMGDVIYF